MSIFILEDNVIQAQHLKCMVEDICEKNQIPYDFIEVTSKSQHLVEKIPTSSYVPIYFLDIEIKNEIRKGLEVAQEIRKYDSEGMIAFITTHSEFAPISYQYMVSALTFIDKALPYDERYNLVKQCLLHYEARNAAFIPLDDFIIDNANATVRVPFETVEYIRTDEPHRLALITTEQLIHFYGTLKEVELVDNRLFRCHQSYIVNIEKISYYNKTKREIILKSDKRIPVSRRLSRQLRQLIEGEL